MQDFVLRLATPADLEALHALDALCDGAGKWSRAVWNESLQPAEGAGLQRVTFVAERAASLAGFAVLHCTWDFGEIENLGVHPSARGQGIGKALCTALLRWAREQHLPRVQLEVRSSNLAAQALYRALGFQQDGRRPGYYRNPDEDAMLLHLPLLA